MLKDNGYRESIINKIFRRVTNNHSLPQSQQLTQITDIQEEEIRISINFCMLKVPVKNYSKCRRDCQREKQNHCIMSALFCRQDFSATSKVQNYQNKTREKYLNPNK